MPVRDAGRHVLRAVASDADGRQTRTELTFYALGRGTSSWREDGNWIDLVPERETWKPGESARILIQSPWERATALVTVERESVRSHRTLEIASTHDTIDVPITEADVPNVFVSVVLVKGRTSGELSRYQCGNGGFALWAGQCGYESAYLTAYVLHVMKAAGTRNVSVDAHAVERALDYLEGHLREEAPRELQWWPVWGASQAYSVKMLAEFGRKPAAAIDRLAGLSDRLPIFALSYLADALAASHDRGPRYRRVIARLSNALRVEADRAHVEEVDEDSLAWLWNSNVRATAVVLDGFSRRRDKTVLAAPLARWLIAARTNGRWGTTHENAMALEALAAHFSAVETDVPQMTAAVAVGSKAVGQAAFDGRSTAARQIDVPMVDLLEQIGADKSTALSIARTGTGRLHYTARVQYLAPEPRDAVDRGFGVERRYERYAADAIGPSATSFIAGDLIRVTVVLTLRGEGRYLALTDPLPAGFEPLDGWLRTTATDLNLTGSAEETSWDRWRSGTFQHVEKHADRVVAFATRLASGRHKFSYLVRATTAGTFNAPGARVEAMYAPELTGRSDAATVIVNSR